MALAWSEASGCPSWAWLPGKLRQGSKVPEGHQMSIHFTNTCVLGETPRLSCFYSLCPRQEGPESSEEHGRNL